MIKGIKKVLAGLLAVPVLAFGALVLPMTAPVSAACDTSNQTLQGGVNCAAPSGQEGSTLFGANSIFTKVVNILLFLIGAIAVIMLIFGGIRYTISAGRDKEVEAAKNTILYAIIGIVVAFLAYAVVNWVLTGLAGN